MGRRILAGYVIRRLVSMIPVLFLVSIGVFSLVHLIPGDPALAMLGDQATPQAVEALRARMGLNQPLPVQYVWWLGAVLHGDLGRSVNSNQPVTQAIVQRLPVTIELTILGVLLSLLIAIPSGIVAAVRRNSLMDTTLTTISVGGVALPHFFLGILLIFVFSLHLGILPPIGYKPILADPIGNLERMVMPAFTLGTGLAAIVMRMTRSSLLEVLRQDYVRTARAKGLSRSAVIRRHALKNSLIPVVTTIGLQVGRLLGGAIITETIFALPGVGLLLINSIFQRDYPLVQGIVLFAALTFLMANFIVDLLYAYLDPRIHYA